MGQTHEREAAIFDAAMELPPGERAAYLDRACGGDAALRQRIEALLKACESRCEFLDSPNDPAAGAPTNVLPSFEKAGDRIGHYKLLQQIGEGGCGVVYGVYGRAGTTGPAAASPSRSSNWDWTPNPSSPASRPSDRPSR